MNIKSDLAPKLIQTAVSESQDASIAARELHHGLSVDDIACVVFFCSASYDLEALSKQLSRLFNGVKVVGCTTAGEITPLGYQQKTITGFALPSNEFLVESCFIKDLASFSVAEINHHMESLVDSVKSRAMGDFDSQTFAISLLDGLSIMQEQVMQALHDSLNDIPLVGGSAGDDLLFNDTHVYYDGEFHDNAAVIMLINTQLPFKVMSDHHLLAQEEKLVVTKADPQMRTVHELNAEPAAQEYCRITGLSTDQLTPTNFALNPLAVQFGEELFIRAIQKLNDDNSLTFFCAVDIGVVLTQMKSADIATHVRYMFDDLKYTLGELQLVIAYDCIHRRIEIEHFSLCDDISELYRKYNFIGFNTYGEQYEGKHINHTLSCVAIGRQAE